MTLSDAQRMEYDHLLNTYPGDTSLLQTRHVLDNEDDILLVGAPVPYEGQEHQFGYFVIRPNGDHMAAIKDDFEELMSVPDHLWWDNAEPTEVL